MPEEISKVIESLNYARNRQNYNKDDIVVCEEYLRLFFKDNPVTSIEELCNYFYHGKFDNKRPVHTLKELGRELARLESVGYISIENGMITVNENIQ